MARSSSVTRSEFNFKRMSDLIEVCEIIMNSCGEELSPYANKRYLGSCMIAYSSIMNDSRYKDEAKKIREVLVENKHQWNQLRFVDQVKMKLMIYCPDIYLIIREFYSSRIRKIRYE